MTIGILISCVFITLKTYLGGLTAVIWTDAIQGTVQTIGIIALGVCVYFLTGGWENVSVNVNSLGMTDFLSPTNAGVAEILIPFLTIGAATLVRQDTWQRVWAAKNIKVSVMSNWLACFFVLLTGVVIIFIGVFAKAGLNIVTDKPELIYYDVIFGSIPFWFGAIMFIVLIATILSCADSFFIAGSTTIVSDVIKPLMKRWNIWLQSN
ncbi:hypothetical protein MHI02_04015 [Oceanobacillus sp. FSL K6-0118]